MKKRWIIIVVMVLAAVFGIVFFVSRNLKKEYAADVYGWNGVFWMTDKGAFASKGTHLGYYNPSSGKNVLICNKIGCSHGEDCPAAFSGNVTGVTYDEEGLLYLSIEGCSRFDEIILYHANADGTNRKRLHLFSSVQMVNHVRVSGKYMLISCQNLLDGEGNDLELPENKVILYDLKTGKEKILFQQKNINSYLGSCSMDEENVYFAYGYSDLSAEDVLAHSEDEEFSRQHYCSGIYCVSLEGGKAKVLCENVSGMQYVPVLDGKLFYSTVEAACVFDLETGESRELVEGECDVIPVFPGREGRVILRPMEEQSGEGKRIYYDVDAAEESLQKIETADFFLLGLVGDVAYFTDGAGNYGYCSKEDFYQGKAEKISIFENIVDKQLGE